MDGILSFLKEFDIKNILPDMSTFLGRMEAFTRLAVILGPLVLLALGAWYFFKPPKYGTNTMGFRTRASKSSRPAWEFAQRLAGFIWMILGGGLFLIMLIISLFYGKMEPMAMVVTALVCVVLEALLVLASYIVVDVLIKKNFNLKNKK